MSIIRYTPMELSDIVEESNLILEVKCIEPYTEEVAIRSNDQEAPVRPFIKEGFVFSVVSILKNTAAIVVPQTIRVPKEEWRRSFSQHKEMYANGPSKSYSIKRYNSDARSMKKADILFLHHFQGIYELTAKDSFELLAAREKIDMLIAAG